MFRATRLDDVAMRGTFALADLTFAPWIDSIFPIARGLGREGMTAAAMGLATIAGSLSELRGFGIDLDERLSHYRIFRVCGEIGL